VQSKFNQPSFFHRFYGGFTTVRDDTIAAWKPL
jgi:hypothetical protein